VELHQLRTIVAGLDSLAEVERTHPQLGAELLGFVEEVRKCCEVAYTRLSEAMGAVLKLPLNPNEEALANVREVLSDAPSSVWYRDIANICNRLEVVADQFGPAISEQLDYLKTQARSEQRREDLPAYMVSEGHFKLMLLLEVLRRHEGDLKLDAREAVSQLQLLLGARYIGDEDRAVDIPRAKELALNVQREIQLNLDQIQRVVWAVKGSSNKGTTKVLTSEQIAEDALRRPERMLILNMFFIVVAMALAATLFQFINVWQFVLVDQHVNNGT